MSSLFSLDGRVALITGASRGLGCEIARAMAVAGASVVVNSRDPEEVDRRVQELRAAGFRAEGAPFDVASHADVVAAIDGIVERHGHLDIVVANVGQRLRVPFTDMTLEQFEDLVRVNLVATWDLAHEAVRVMLPRREGRLIFMGTTAATRATPGSAAYAPTKAGVEALARSLATEYGALGITANVLAPGGFLTEHNSAGPSTPGFLANVPAGRWGEPGEVAGTAVFLASDAASFVNGTTTFVDGGWMASSYVGPPPPVR